VEEQTAHESAAAHAAHVQAGDMAAIQAECTPEMFENLRPVARGLPRPVTGWEVLEVTVTADRAVVRIRYDGADASCVVRSEWVAGPDRPLMAACSLD
jgi:hypothetical protein